MENTTDTRIYIPNTSPIFEAMRLYYDKYYDSELKEIYYDNYTFNILIVPRQKLDYIKYEIILKVPENEN